MLSFNLIKTPLGSRSLLKMRKLILQEDKYLPEGPAVGKWQNQIEC